jgi:hypothetical protein
LSFAEPVEPVFVGSRSSVQPNRSSSYASSGMPREG